MRVSVIVPFFNEESYIEQCVTALLTQHFPREEYEVIFVDNGSRDRSADVVRRYPEIVLLEERTPGPYAARNRGLAVARGDVIAFTDADCVPSADWLTQFWEGLMRTQAKIALGRQRFPSQKPGALRMCEDYGNAKVAYVLSQGTEQQMVAFTNNMAVRAEVIRAIGPFAGWIRGADIEFMHRAVARFCRETVIYLPDMIVTHLELNGFSRWLGKQVVYGRSMRRIERESPHRPLGYRERCRIYRSCATANHYSAWQGIGLLGTLMVGMCCFEAGRIWGSLHGD